jgi:hypothetical protein
MQIQEATGSGKNNLFSFGKYILLLKILFMFGVFHVWSGSFLYVYLVYNKVYFSLIKLTFSQTLSILYDFYN